MSPFARPASSIKARARLIAAGALWLYAIAANAQIEGSMAAVQGLLLTGNALPTVSVSAPAPNATLGAMTGATVRATAADSDGALSKVEFYAGATLIGTVTSAPYAVTWTPATAGSYVLTARATDNAGEVSISTGVTVTVLANAFPTVSLTGPANNAHFNAPATIAFAASASDTDGAVTKVEFFDGTTLLGTATSAPYTFTASGVAAGNHSYTARATDNLGGTTTSAAIAVNVNAAPGVSLTSPANNAGFNAPANIALSASAQDSDGTIAEVAFFQGPTLLATLTSAPYTHTLNAVQPGTYVFTARATDNQGATTTSSAASITVSGPVANLFYIHTDHLNTPRLIQDQAGATVWRHDNTEPFAGSVPDENPNGLGTFEFSLGFDGQYRDQETGLLYNVTRNYSPGIGRYIEADLAGGVLFRNMALTNLGTLGVVHPELIALLYSRQPRLNHLYAYVGSNPLSYSDSLGLIWPIDCYNCFKKQNEMEDALKECKKEYDNCETLRDQIDFIEKYGGGFISSAIYNCATQKNPGTFGDMIKSCGACGLNPKGPWPLKK